MADTAAFKATLITIMTDNILELPTGEQFAVGIDTPARFETGRLRRLDNFTTLYVNHGGMTCEVDFREFRLDEGDMFYLGAWQFFECKDTTDVFTVSYITFHPDIMAEATRSFGLEFFSFLKEYPVMLVRSADDANRVRLILDMANYIYADHGHTFRLPIFKNMLQTCLMDLYDKTKAQFINRRRQNTSRQEELLERFVHDVFSQDGRQREVKVYADRLCVSTRYLSSVVSALTGYTPKKIIDGRCVQEIKTMLRTTDDTMQEIAFKLGFPDQSFFTRYFKKHTGVIPAEYRRSGKVKG